MWHDLVLMLVVWSLVLAPCMVAMNGAGSTAEDEATDNEQNCPLNHS